MRRLRRLMANDTAYGLVLLVFVAAVVMWIYWPHHRARAIVRTQTTVLVEPPATPLLRDSGPANNNARTGHLPASRQSPPSPTASRLPPTSAGSQKRPLPRHDRKAPKTPPRRKPVPQRPNPAPQPPNPPPRPPPPAVGVTVPAPVTICLRPAAGVNCP